MSVRKKLRLVFHGTARAIWLINSLLYDKNKNLLNVHQNIPVMSEGVLRWPMFGETYLEVLDCLGEVLVDLLERLRNENEDKTGTRRRHTIELI